MKGIYGFKNKHTGMWYIGQSVNTEARFGQHIQDTLTRLMQDKEQVKFHKALAEHPFDNNNWEYHVFENDVNATPEQLDLWEAQYIDAYDCYRNGYNSTKGNHAELITKIQKSSMHMVPQSLSHYMWNHFDLRNLTNKIVLLIGQFKLADNLVMNDNDVTVICDNIAYSEDGAKLIRVNGKGELMAEIKKLKGKHFDYIIANPPYEIGNQVTSSVIDNVDFDNYINLMPLSKYKGNNLSSHVMSLELADPKAFDDASITDNLSICRLTPYDTHKTFDDLAQLTYAPEYREFYKLNSSITHYAISNYERTPKAENIKYDYDNNKAFAITARTALDGVHKVDGKKGSFDVEFNINKTKTINDTNIWKHSDGTLAQSAVGYIYFNTEVEKNNLCKFWYYNSLMNDLLKGLNQTGGCFTVAIPNIDWSKERDYEHLTLDDIMNILREENPDVA